MNNMTGGWYPAMMWREFMKEALQNVPAQRFVKAKNLIKRRIDKHTGYLAMDDTNDDDVNIELFWRGSQPKPIVDSYRDENNQKKDTELIEFFDM